MERIASWMEKPMAQGGPWVAAVHAGTLRAIETLKCEKRESQTACGRRPAVRGGRWRQWVERGPTWPTVDVEQGAGAINWVPLGRRRITQPRLDYEGQALYRLAMSGG